FFQWRFEDSVARGARGRDRGSADISYILTVTAARATRQGASTRVQALGLRSAISDAREKLSSANCRNGAPKLDERWWCSTFDGSTSFSCGAAAVEVSLLSMGWVVFSSGTVGEDVDADRSRCFFAKAATSRANCSTSAWSMSNRLSSSSY